MAGAARVQFFRQLHRQKFVVDGRAGGEVVVLDHALDFAGDGLGIGGFVRHGVSPAL